MRRAGFAYRRTYELFLERYKSLSQSTWPNYKGNAKDGVEILVKSLGYDSEEYRMGKYDFASSSLLSSICCFYYSSLLLGRRYLFVSRERFSRLRTIFRSRNIS